MPFEANAVLTEYRFSGNAQAFLTKMAEFAERAARMTGTVTRGVKDLGVTVELVSPRVAAFTAELRELDVAGRAATMSLRGITTNLGGVGTKSTASAGNFAAASDVIVNSARTAETRVAASAERIVASLGAVTASARESGAAMRSMGGGGGAGSSMARVAAGGGFGAGAATIAGFAGLVTLGAGLRGASELQDAQTQIAVALGRRNGRYTTQGDVARQFEPIAMEMSNATAQSVTQSTQLLRVMATAGLNDPAQMRALAMPIARFADTQYLGSHRVAFEDSATTAVQLAHQFGARTAAQMSPILNTLFKISQDMPDSLKQAATQLKYYAPQFTNAGVSPTEILSMQAAADRLGLGGGRSGTGFRALLASLQKPSSDKMVAAQSALHLLDAQGNDRFINQKTGVFAQGQFFDYLNTQYDAARRNGTMGAFQKNLAGISTGGAGSVLSLFASDAGKRQRDAVAQTLLRVPDLQIAQAQLLDTLNNQTKRLSTNFETLSTKIIEPLIGPLTHFVSMLADVVGNIGSFLAAHPTAQIGATAATVGLGAYGGYKLFQMIGGISSFVHVAAHEARRHAGIPSVANIARGGHGGMSAADLVTDGLDVADLASNAGGAGRFGRMFGRIGEGARDFLTFGRTRRMVGGAAARFAESDLGGALGGAGRFVGREFGGANIFGSVARLFGSAIEFMTGHLRVATYILKFVANLFGRGLLPVIMRLGSRAIPVVGEILLLIDMIKFLGSHAKDIGYGLGVAVKWIRSEGLKLVVEGFKALVMGIVEFLKDTLVGLFNGGHGGIWDALRTGLAAYNAGNSDTPAPARAQSSGKIAKATRKFANPHGQHAFLQGGPPGYEPMSGEHGAGGMHLYGDIHIEPKTGSVHDVHRELVNHMRSQGVAYNLPTMPGARSGQLIGADTLGA